MKEATGELNMTVVVVISVGVLLAFFYTILWPMIKSNMARTQNCNNAICDKKTLKDGSVQCQHYNDKGEAEGNKFTCAWKG